MLKILSLIFLLFFFFPQKTLAAELSTGNIPATIEQSQEFEIDINLSCPGCGDSYLRGVFYPSGNKYFGFTQDNLGNWSNAPGTNCTTFYKISKSNLTAEGTWNGKVKFKPDAESSNYSGPGDYLFKVGRYTPSCGSPSVWSSEATIAITGPTPTPSPTTTPSSTPITSPTKTPTPKPSTPKPTVAPIATSISVSLSDEEEATSSVLSESSPSSELEIEKTPKAIVEETTVASDNNFQKILIGAGLLFIISSAFWFIRSLKQKNL